MRNQQAANVIMLLLFSFVCLGACAEAKFQLANNSALPRWFELPPGRTRSEVTVRLAYYIPLSGSSRTATLKLVDQDGRVIDDVAATLVGKQPRSLVPDPGSGPIPYPHYEVLVADGKSEVIVHQRPEPVFRIESDPDIRRQLGVRD